MLRITCPHCGERSEVEFRCGGQSHIQRPELGCSDEAWQDYLYNRVNPKGIHTERWLHQHGCGRWFNLARSTVTHAILATYAMTDPKPEGLE
ncbi:sarcosine oxidase subunit delta [Erythrobacter sp. NE805]|uniref:sarcosine oxidase subunit delta n=1 Tax=Erythrobacter sp. NE805 TaxID=3389875 RepID=UPI00396B1D06